MLLYTALTKEGWPIATVVAKDEREARRLIREQLDRPGRRWYLQQWREGGERIKTKTCQEVTR